jgi:MFS family permease
MENTQAEEKAHPIPYHEVERAAKLSYAQAMLGSVYAASTGGMFLIGYALALGANNVQIGLMSTIPMLAVVVQLISSFFVERGFSRKKLTVLASLCNVSGWAAVALLPVMVKSSAPGVRIAVLIALIAAINAFAHLLGNARASWIGDLIPADMRGLFFGKMTMYAGFVGVFFALAEGKFLDRVKDAGTSAFGWLFAFGMFFGLVSLLLFLPQSDVPLEDDERKRNLMQHVVGTFSNKPLMVLMAFATVWSLQTIATPFYATYLLRDLRVPFLGVGAINAAGALTILLSSPFWGQVVGRYGCRPVIVVTVLATAPTMLVWLFVDRAVLAYALVIPVNLYQGFLLAGTGVALNTLFFKLTPSVGRSAQIAVYSIVVVLIAAPMPTLGGYLTSLLASVHVKTDVRITFYLVCPIMLASAFLARRITEEDSRPAGDLLRDALGSVRSVLLSGWRAR